MAVVPLFKHRKKHTKVVGNSNRTYAFTNHQYFTTNEAEIAELTKLATSGVCGIYIDQAQPTIDTDAATPMAQLEKSIRENLLAELKAEGKLVEESSSDQSPGLAKIVSTADSTINGNSAAEQADEARKAAQAEQQLANNPALAALNALKQGQPEQQKK